MNDPMSDWSMLDLLNEGKARGIQIPVVAALYPHSRMARAIYAERHGKPLPRPNRAYATNFCLEFLTAAEAAHLFRQHGGIVGTATAALLSQPTPKVDGWVALVQKDYLALIIHARRGRALMTRGYYNIFPGFCGPSPKEAYYAASLIQVVVNGSLDVGLPVDDDVLALILQQHYLASPRVVAEAVRVLRKRGKEEDRWLLRVLDSRPELKGLARAVRHELQGD